MGGLHGHMTQAVRLERGNNKVADGGDVYKRQVLERAGVAASELSRGGVPDIERRLGSISTLASDLDLSLIHISIP